MPRHRSTCYALLAVLVLILLPVDSGRAHVVTPSWSQIVPSGSPPGGNRGRLAPAVLYDRSTNRMVLFGGYNGLGSPPGGLLNDLWLLMNADGLGSTPAWFLLNPHGSPPSGRAYAANVYDPKSNRMTIFGGQGCCVTLLNDTWVLSHANALGGTPKWTRLHPLGGGPSARLAATAVYDARSNRMIVFGGFDGRKYLNDTWVLAHANGQGGTPAWTLLNPGNTLPPPRNLNTAVYDPTTNRMIIFSGQTQSNSNDDVWVLTHANGHGGSSAWIRLNPPGRTPGPRAGHTAVYSVTTNKMVIFAGSVFTNAGATFPSDVWVLSNANGATGTPLWAQLSPTGTDPGGRTSHTAVYNSLNNRMTIFGGQVCVPFVRCPVFANDTWVLANALPVVPFAGFLARLDLDLASKELEAAATFMLGEGRHGIMPVAEQVSFEAGDALITIPAGSFREHGKGRFRFEGTLDGVAIDASIDHLRDKIYTFKIEANGVSNLPTTNPVAVTLTIDDNTGTTIVHTKL